MVQPNLPCGKNRPSSTRFSPPIEGIGDSTECFEKANRCIWFKQEKSAVFDLSYLNNSNQLESNPITIIPERSVPHHDSKYY